MAVQGARVALFEDELWASTPYLESFVDALKREIPAWGRAWDKGHKMWHVDLAYRWELQSLLDHYYGEWRSVSPAELGLEPEAGQRRARQAAGACEADRYAALHLLPTAPPELVKAAYRCLAMLNHPDRGGDTRAMQVINEAYEALK